MLILLFIAYLGALVLRYQKYRTTEVVINLVLPKVTAYTSAKSYMQGDSINLYVHAEDSFVGEIFKVGYEQYEKVGNISGGKIQQSGNYSLRFGHNWDCPYKLSTENYKPGFYLVCLRLSKDSKERFSLPILIRSKKGNEIVVVSPTHTWQAYNEYGGKSNYTDTVTPKDLKLVFRWLEMISPTLSPYTHLPKRRPLNHKIAFANQKNNLSLLNGKISSDLYLIEFLEEREKKYDVISDEDFEKGIGLENAQLVIFHNHSEYWSYEGIGMLKNYLREGVNFAFFSGNNMYRGVESIAGETLIVLEQQLPRSGIEPVLGTFYSESGYLSLGSFQVKKANHWVFDGTGLKNGEKFGNGMISGIETDKMGAYSEGFTLLAVGDNESGPAHMVIKSYPKGNFLFNASSVSSVRALKEDENWWIIVQNIINKSEK